MAWYQFINNNNNTLLYTENICQVYLYEQKIFLFSRVWSRNLEPNRKETPADSASTLMFHTKRLKKQELAPFLNFLVQTFIAIFFLENE
jgi:hypothetical protein